MLGQGNWDSMKHVLAILIVLIVAEVACAAPPADVDFDAVMQQYDDTEGQVAPPSYYYQMHALYERHRPSHMPEEALPLIPKTIHQIWLGPHPIPPLYKEYMATWKKLHPGWEFVLWTDKDVERWNFTSKDLFHRASSYQEKSDILRYEILFLYGGVYMDVDYVCLKSLEPLHHRYEFYASLEPHYPSTQVTGAIIASKPGNKIFQEALARARAHWEEIDTQFPYFDGAHDIVAFANKRMVMPLTPAINDNLDLLIEHRGVVLPASYLFPYSPGDDWLDQVRKWLHLGYHQRLVQMAQQYIRPETMAIQDVGVLQQVTNLTDKEILDWRQTLRQFWQRLSP